MRIVIIDNYDSFTYNLSHYLKDYSREVHVVRHNEVSLDVLAGYDGIVLSPGPGLPHEAGISEKAVEAYKSSKKILGVCLGHQVIGLHFGARLKNLTQVMHGVSLDTHICLPHDAIYNGIPEVIACGRYHSWVIDSHLMPDCLKVTAIDDFGEVMSVRHSLFDVCGVQFHPESIMTPYGKEILRNWVKS